jgi:hypothetical protein
MCDLCNGTHVVHEITNIGYRTSCCPKCGPEPAEIQNERLTKIIEQANAQIRRVVSD